MKQLNLPSLNIGIKIIKNKEYIFDRVRKKWLVHTPEEWVRQNFIQFLIQYKNYPCSLFSIETGIEVNKMKRRGDVIIYKNKLPAVIIECKSPDVNITQKVFEQIAQYNLSLKASYLIVTNGLKHYCCKMDYEINSYNFINKIPDYEDLSLLGLIS